MDLHANDDVTSGSLERWRMFSGLSSRRERGNQVYLRSLSAMPRWWR